jgi:hypothetical protein
MSLEGTPTFDKDFGHGRLLVWSPRQELSITRIEGHFSSEIAAAFVEQVEPTIRASTRFVGMHDWTGADSFDIAVPAKLAGWTISLLSNVHRIVIATRHPLVSMAVRTANLTIRRIEHVGTREAWLESLSTLDEA